MNFFFSLSSGPLYILLVSFSRSLLLYALNILLILHLSLYLPLFKFPTQTILIQLSHSYYIGLHKFSLPISFIIF